MNSGCDLLSYIPSELLDMIISFLTVSSRFFLFQTTKRYVRYKEVYERIDYPYFKNRSLYPKEREHIIINDIIINRHTRLFKWIVPRSDIQDRSRFTIHQLDTYIETAAEKGSFGIVKYIHGYKLKYSDYHTLSVSAASGGHLNIFIWLQTKLRLYLKCGAKRNRNLDEYQSIAYAAARCGQFHIIKYLHEKKCAWGKDVCSYAAKYGDINTLKWARQIKCKWNNDACSNAALNGHFEILQYLRENGCPWDEDTCSNAALSGHFEILQYLHNNGCPWNENACSSAALNGHFEILQYLHENGCPWDEDSCSNAAYNGHFEILKYLHDNGCPWDESACSDAADSGHLEILQYLHANGCPWNEYACSNAACSGHFEILQYLHENGCPWDESACSYAVYNGHFEILKYLCENDCQVNEEVCGYAAAIGHFEILRYLLNHDGKFALNPDVLDNAAKNDLLDIVECLNTNGSPWNELTCNAASERSCYSGMMYWLEQNRCPWRHDIIMYQSLR